MRVRGSKSSGRPASPRGSDSAGRRLPHARIGEVQRVIVAIAGNVAAKVGERNLSGASQLGIVLGHGIVEESLPSSASASTAAQVNCLLTLPHRESGLWVTARGPERAHAVALLEDGLPVDGHGDGESTMRRRREFLLDPGVRAPRRRTERPEAASEPPRWRTTLRAAILRRACASSPLSLNPGLRARGFRSILHRVLASRVQSGARVHGAAHRPNTRPLGPGRPGRAGRAGRGRKRASSTSGIVVGLAATLHPRLRRNDRWPLRLRRRAPDQSNTLIQDSSRLSTALVSDVWAFKERAGGSVEQLLAPRLHPLADRQRLFCSESQDPHRVARHDHSPSRPATGIGYVVLRLMKLGGRSPRPRP